jgi:hypothetical protein
MAVDPPWRVGRVLDGGEETRCAETHAARQPFEEGLPERMSGLPERMSGALLV